MYTKRIQIISYGPIDQLDIAFPFEGNKPKPVLLVGENGSGKSILLSHVVNGLITAKSVAYPETPEVEVDKVYKLRSDFYIKTGKDSYFARINFEDNLFTEEIRSLLTKKEYSIAPMEFSGTDVQNAWNSMNLEEKDYFKSNFHGGNENKIKDVFSRNCVLYFPPNRFEEPAWLNEENLKAKAKYMNLKHLTGYTTRKVINYSTLHDNQNWLFDVLYDRGVFEIQTPRLPIAKQDDLTVSYPFFLGYSGIATSIYEIALQIIRSIIRGNQSTRFGIGTRLNRVVSIIENEQNLVPNIFQLSSGETSLMNLFLSILRDFDLSGAPFTKADDIRGIVVVDEIDLHLHAVHQYEILPELIKIFPNVQFLVTTHSPLFILGMKKVFGEDGFALYRLPQGQQIGTEEFTEFTDAYKAFTETSKFSDEIQTAIKNARKPLVFVGGKTDREYLLKASELLGQETKEILEKVEILECGGNGNLKNAWNSITKLPENPIPQKVLFLYDCDNKIDFENKGNFFRQNIPLQSNHLIKKGIENLFNRTTLEKGKNYKPAFIDITYEHKKTNRGENEIVPEEWEVNTDEKTNLCNWLCENGTAEDFQHFREVFNILREILDPA